MISLFKEKVNERIKNGKSYFSGNYVGPFDKDYVGYFDYLKAYNRDIHKRLAGFLKDYCEDVRDFAVCFVGSDARHEKGPVSLAELLIIHDSKKGLESFEKCSANVAESLVASELYHFIEGIEVKSSTYENGQLLSESVCINKKGDSVCFVSPNRLFDSRFVYGDEQVYDLILGNFVTELFSDVGAAVFKKIKSRVRDHSKITLSGLQKYKGNVIQHVDLENGFAYYNLEGKHSFKQGPLRTLQFALVRDQIRSIREGCSNLILGLPRGTVGKLNHLAVLDKLNLSSGELSDLTDSYKYFLWLYHKSQWSAQRNGCEKIEIDSAEVLERSNSLVGLCKHSLIK